MYLFLWDQALNTERLIPKAGLEQAFTSGTTDDGTPVGYGFGWITNVFPYCNAVERRQLLGLGDAGLRHVAHGGGCVALLQLHHSFSRYPAHDRRPDQSPPHQTGVGTTSSSGHSWPTPAGASDRGNPLQRLSRVPSFPHGLAFGNDRGEGPESTQLSRSRQRWGTAAEGHEDAFPRPRLSARCRLSEGTFAGRGTVLIAGLVAEGATGGIALSRLAASLMAACVARRFVDDALSSPSTTRARLGRTNG
jgi:hypothetical protein